MSAKAAPGFRDRVADDGYRRQVGCSQAHDLRLAEIGDLPRFEAHDRRSHGINRDGICASDNRDQRDAPAISGALAVHGFEAIDQADPRFQE
jgi:hypothetical protein